MSAEHSWPHTRAAYEIGVNISDVRALRCRGSFLPSAMRCRLNWALNAFAGEVTVFAALWVARVLSPACFVASALKRVHSRMRKWR